MREELMQKHLEKRGSKPASESHSGKRAAPSKSTASKAASPKRAQSYTRGVHHLALCTDDIKKTTEFYTRVLGMPLIHALKVPPGLGTGKGNRGNPPYEEIRHYFFDMGNDSTVAFFEIPQGKEPATNRNAIGSMQHCSFVVTPQRFRDIEERLKANNVSYIGPIPQMPGLDGIYFMDPNGIRLEFACQTADGDDPHVIECCTQTKASALHELRTLPGVDEAWLKEMTANLPD
jgi:catechol 2,3-dioxygenase-like lactoylglutathione lyase family enzyme